MIQLSSKSTPRPWAIWFSPIWTRRVFPPLPDTVETRALETLSNIKAVLDDQTLDDSDCYGRIEAIVTEFYAVELYVPRHDWG